MAKNTSRIVTFGELLLRFSKPGSLRLTQGDMFTSKYGGSEANVAVSLAAQGEHVRYITRLPDTAVGRAGAMSLAQLGVDVSNVLYGGTRIGTYYFEPAAGMRAAKVVYDRDHSAYYDLKPGMIPWREILKDATVFHVSGITAAISQQAADATFEAMDIADELGIAVSFDINYRKNLWKYGSDPRETLQRMLARCDMMFGDAIEFEWISQHQQPPFTATDTHFEMQMEAYGEWFDELHAAFPRCRQWLMGMRNMVSSWFPACHQHLPQRPSATAELLVGGSSIKEYHPWRFQPLRRRRNTGRSRRTLRPAYALQSDRIILPEASEQSAPRITAGLQCH